MIIHGDQKEITDFQFEDFELVDYDPYPTIKAPIAV
jgi:thymidylate synthase